MSDKIATANLGRSANLALQILGPEIEAVRQNTVTKLKQMYIDGSATEVRLLAGVAELVVLDNLESKLRTRIRRGEQALKELHDE